MQLSVSLHKRLSRTRQKISQPFSVRSMPTVDIRWVHTRSRRYPAARGQRLLFSRLQYASESVYCHTESCTRLLSRFLMPVLCKTLFYGNKIILMSCAQAVMQVGAHIHTVTKEEYTRTGSEALLQQLSEQLCSQGRKPYSIPVGGSNSLGCWGYLEAVRELEGQVADLGITDIALVSSSDTALGKRLE